MVEQKLRGLVGQRMTASRSQPAQALFAYPTGSHTFTVPREGAGLWRFVVWGGGGGGSQEAGGGAGLAIKDMPMSDGQRVSIVVGGAGQASTVMLPGTDVTAGGGTVGSPGIGGVATGGDVNVPGSNSAGSSGGAAGSFAGYLGGGGGIGVGRAGQSPGGGAGLFTGTGLQEMAGSGLVLVLRVKAN